MQRNGRLFVALHILAHLAEAGDQPTTSAALGKHCQTNAVVVRRTLAGLREAGIVDSVKGHGGGWTLARPAASITLREIYVALGKRGEFVQSNEPAADGCLVEAAIGAMLDDFYAEAEALLMQRLDEITAADLATDVYRRLAERKATRQART